jgi:carbon starvation protein
VARLGRLAFEELFSPGPGAPDGKNPFRRFLRGKAPSSLCTLLPAYMLAILGYQNIWALFGAANQLLAALTLIACTLFFKMTGRRILALLFPTLIMLAVTYSSLALTIWDKVLLVGRGTFRLGVDGLQLGLALLLLVLGILAAVSCAAKILEKPPQERPSTP